MSDIALPKNQAVLDRLRRRIENYRGRHEESLPRFEHTTNGLNEQQKADTLLLRNRFLESKAKKSHKNKDKKGEGGAGSSKAKRHLEDGEGGEGLDGVPPKKMCGVEGKRGGTKVKLFPGGGGTTTAGAAGTTGSAVGGSKGVGGFLDSEYVDLEQLMALDEDPASSMLLGDSETFKELLSDFDPYQDMDEFEFGGYEDKSDSATAGASVSSHPANSTNVGGPGGNNPAVAPVTPGPTVKIEEYMLHQPLCAGPSPAPAATASPLASQLGSSEQHHYHATSSPLNTGSSSGNGNSSKRLPMYSASPGSSSGLSIDNSAAQTLKHMAEQRQHKTGTFKTSPARSPYSDSYPPPNSTFPPPGQDFVAGLVGGSGGATSSNGGNPSSGSGGSSNCYGPRLGESPDLSSIKQEVYSPTTQTTFSPGFMDVNSVNQSKRGGPGGPSRIQQQQQQVLSPVNKSFNHQNSGMDNNMSGQSFMGRPPNISNNNPSPSGCYPGGFPTNPVPSGPQQMPGRGSPIDSKVRNNLPNLQQQQQQQQQQQHQQQQQFYSYNGMGGMPPGGGQPQQQPSGGPMVDSFNPSGLSPGGPQQQTNGPQGQTINFTQQHLRPPGPPPGPNLPPARMAVPPSNLNRMPPRMLTASDPMNPMNNPRMQMQQQQPQQQQQQMMRQQQQQLVPQPQPHPQQQPQQGMMMNRFPRNGPRGPPQGMMMPGMAPQQRHTHIQQQQQQQQQQMQQHHQAYNGQQQQMMMSGGGPYNNGNHNHNPNNPSHMQQSSNMSPMRDQQQQQWMSMQQQHNPHMDPNSRQYPNMNGIVHTQQQQGGPMRHHGPGPMSYHSGMNMPMSQSQPHQQQSMNNGFGGGGSGGMMSYPNQQQQQQHLSGFNQGGNVNKGPQTHSSQGMYNVNPNYGMKATGMMTQQQQQQHPGMYGGGGNNGPNANASKMSGLNPDLLNFEQVLDNLVQVCPVTNGEADPSGFSSDDFLLESNYA